MSRSTLSKPQWFCCCGNTPCDGLDCGVYLPGHAPRAPRAPRAPKSAAEARDARLLAWATRRAKYGERGHA